MWRGSYSGFCSNTARTSWYSLFMSWRNCTPLHTASHALVSLRHFERPIREKFRSRPNHAERSILPHCSFAYEAGVTLWLHSVLVQDITSFCSTADHTITYLFLVLSSFQAISLTKTTSKRLLISHSHRSLQVHQPLFHDLYLTCHNLIKNLKSLSSRVRSVGTSLTSYLLAGPRLPSTYFILRAQLLQEHLKYLGWLPLLSTLTEKYFNNVTSFSSTDYV